MPFTRPRFAHLLLGLVVGLASAAIGAPAAGAAGFEVDAAGTDPGVAVDAAGTGHFGWYTETAGVNFVTYCRIPRGAVACEKRTNLPTPLNTDNAPSTVQVLVDGSRVIVIGSMFNAVGKPGGLFAWISPDGGTTFPASPVRITKDTTMEDSALGPNGTSVFTIGGNPPYSFAGALDGSTGAQAQVQLGTGVSQSFAGGNEGAVGLISSTQPFTVFTDSNQVWLRRFDPTKTGYNTPANWLAPQVFGQNEWEPVATGGLSGAFIGTTPTAGNPLGKGPIVRRINDDGTVGAAKALVPGSAVNARDLDLFEDAEGRVHAVYLDIDHAQRLTYQWSRRGETWGIPQVIDAPDQSFSHNQLSLAPDGGGFVVNERVPGAYGRIRITPIDPKGDTDPPLPPTPTPAPGATPAPPTPTPAPACPLKVVVSPAADAVVRSGPCFTDLGQGRFKTSGSVRLAGIDFVPPAAGGTLTLDTKAHTVITTGGQYETRAGSVVLSRGPIAWDLDGQITIDDLGQFGVSLLGLKVAGKADLTFAAKESRIHLWMELPSPMDAVRGDVTVRTTMADGLRLDNVHLTATGVPIGPLYVNDFDLLFSAGTNRFSGSASVTLPPAPPGKEASIKGEFVLEDGKLSKLAIQVGAGVPPLPLPLFATPPILLTRVGIDLTNDEKGFRLGGGVVLSLGPELGGSPAIGIKALPPEHGAYLFVPKSGKYAQIGASGVVTLADLELAYGSVSVRTDGPVTFSGGTTLNLGLVDLDFSGSGGINLANGDFYGAMKGSLGVGNSDLVDATATADAIVSSIGFAACGSASGTLFGVKILDAEIGYEKPWGGDSDVGFCNLDAYKPASLGGSGARAARLRSGPQTISFGKGTHGILVKAVGTAPGFTLTGPGGHTLTVEPGSTRAAAAPGILALPTGNAAVAVEIDDAEGSWTLAPAATGAAVTDVQVAGERPSPKAKATVATAGVKRRLTVKTSNLGDQTMIVREVLPGNTAHELGTVRKAGTTTLTFTPERGTGGRRALEAVVAVGTRQVEVIKLGSYVAPAPRKLAAPRRVTLKRSGTQVTATWTKVPGAAGYRVSVKGSDGRLQLLPVGGKTTRVAIPGITPDDRIDVSVVAVDALSQPGAKRAATTKGKALPKVKAPKTTEKKTPKKK